LEEILARRAKRTAISAIRLKFAMSASIQVSTEHLTKLATRLRFV
jgi:hypothetical protein